MDVKLWCFNCSGRTQIHDVEEGYRGGAMLEVREGEGETVGSRHSH